MRARRFLLVSRGCTVLWHTGSGPTAAPPWSVRGGIREHRLGSRTTLDRGDARLGLKADFSRNPAGRVESNKACEGGAVDSV